MIGWFRFKIECNFSVHNLALSIDSKLIEWPPNEEKVYENQWQFIFKTSGNNNLNFESMINKKVKCMRILNRAFISATIAITSQTNLQTITRYRRWGAVKIWIKWFICIILNTTYPHTTAIIADTSMKHMFCYCENCIKDGINKYQPTNQQKYNLNRIKWIPRKNFHAKRNKINENLHTHTHTHIVLYTPTKKWTSTRK